MLIRQGTKYQLSIDTFINHQIANRQIVNKMMNWKQLISAKRFGMEEFHEERQENRSEFQRDYDRLIFSAPFRRLQNKTQVFPLPGSVFVHNRLTHSLIVKYPFSSSLAGKKSKFGFFITEEESFRRIAEELGMEKQNNAPLKYARHPLVYLVEAADDICYQMMDIEDAHKLKILTTQETKELLLSYFSKERQAHRLKTMEIVSDTNEQIAYLRSSVIGLLIGECVQAFVDNEEKILKGEFEGSLINHISEVPANAYKHCADISLKRFTAHAMCWTLNLPVSVSSVPCSN